MGTNGSQGRESDAIPGRRKVSGSGGRRQNHSLREQSKGCKRSEVADNDNRCWRRNPLRLACQDLIKKLPHGALRLQNRKAVVHRSRQVCIRESDATKRRAPQGLPRGRVSTFAEKEARLRIDVRVTPAIQHDAGDVAFGVKSRSAKHRRELLAYPLFIVSKRGAKHLGTSAMPLLLGR